MHEGTVTLPDGRALGYAEYGEPAGRPIVLFHGLPGGRTYDLEHAALRDAGARLLSLERPGIGLSDPQPDRTLADWPADVTAFADALGIDRFAVVGVSAGGAYAFATALARPDRVTALGLVCGMGPAFDHPEYDDGLLGQVKALMPFARADIAEAKVLARAVLDEERTTFLADREAYWSAFLEGWPENDRHLYVEFKDRWMGNLDATHARQGAYADDAIVVFGPWGLDLAAMQVPVRAWHGDADLSAPLGLIELAVKEAGGDVVVHPGEGHYLDRAHNGDWIAWLVSCD